MLTCDALNQADDRVKLRCTDMIRTVAFGSSISEPDKEICIREVINAAGRTNELGLDQRVRKLAKKLYVQDNPNFEFPKKQIYANGQQISANMWTQSQRSYIERSLAAI